MPLSLELGQVADPYARRALEQVSLNWPPSIPVLRALPTAGVTGQIAFLTADLGLYVFYNGTWRKT